MYGVDLAELDYQEPYSVDLRDTATNLMNKHDHRYDAQ
jgi:hypothetical protein